MGGFVREIGQLRHGELHAGGQFVARDARGQFGITGNCSRCRALSRFRKSEVSRFAAGEMPAGVSRYRIGLPR